MACMAPSSSMTPWLYKKWFHGSCSHSFRCCELFEKCELMSQITFRNFQKLSLKRYLAGEQFPTPPSLINLGRKHKNKGNSYIPNTTLLRPSINIKLTAAVCSKCWYVMLRISRRYLHNSLYETLFKTKWIRGVDRQFIVLNCCLMIKPTASEISSIYIISLNLHTFSELEKVVWEKA